MAKPQTVDDYIAAFPIPVQSRLRELRALSRASAPLAAEGLKWGNPAYSSGTILFAFAGYRGHSNFVFTPSTREAFTDELTAFTTGKGSVQLPHEEPVPADLLRRMIAYRIDEFENQHILWR
ncbi:hypothetical protein GCM10022239_14990 [Leifsonia bigeumensis]|uniref:YdhG-like domain-containing protein n=1 Tax=Leifsonella bigeumensis TaxID=433643 RepID=A0ABP7FNT1_9MICO